MSEEEVRRFVADIFNNSESIKQWREAAELAREERLRQADLLRDAVTSTAWRVCMFGRLSPEDMSKQVCMEEAAWEAYKESL